MLKFAGAILLLVLVAVGFASQGASAAPLPGFSMPKVGNSKPTGTTPKTTNAFDTESLLDVPVKTTSEMARTAAKGATVAGGAAGVIGAGVGAGYSESQDAGLGYSYAG